MRAGSPVLCLLLGAAPVLAVQEGAPDPGREAVRLLDGRVLYGTWIDERPERGVRRLDTACGVLRVAVSELAAEGEGDGVTGDAGEPDGEAVEDAPGTWRELATRYFLIESDVAPSRLALFAGRIDPLVEFLALELGVDGRLAPRAGGAFRCRIFASLDDYRDHRERFAPRMVAEKSRAFLDSSFGYYGDGVVIWDAGPTGDGGDDGLRILHHECAHLVLDQLLGSSGLPMWTNEGLASLLEGLVWEDDGYLGARRATSALRHALRLHEGGRRLSVEELAAVDYGSFEGAEYSLAASFLDALRASGEGVWREFLTRVDRDAGGALRAAREALGVGSSRELDEVWLEHVRREERRELAARRKLRPSDRGGPLRVEAQDLVRLRLYREAAELCRGWLAAPGNARESAHRRAITVLLVQALVELDAADTLGGTRDEVVAVLAGARATYPLDASIAWFGARLALASLVEGHITTDVAVREIGLGLTLARAERRAFFLLADLAVLLEGEAREAARELLTRAAPLRQEEIRSAFLQAWLEDGTEEGRRRWLEAITARAESAPGSLAPGTALDAAAVALALGEHGVALAWCRRSVADLETWWTGGPFAPAPDDPAPDREPIALAAELEAVARRVLPAADIEARALIAQRRFDEASEVQGRMARVLAVVPSLEGVWGERVERLARLLGI